MNHTISEIANSIKQMELDLGLLKDETYGSDARYVWEASRFNLQVYLNRKLSLHGQAHTLPVSVRKMPWFIFICFCGRFLYSVLIKNWLWAPKRREWLIFQHPRRKKYFEKYEDIYTDDLINEIGANKCVIIEQPDQWRHYKPERHRVFHIEFVILISRLVALFIPVYFRNSPSAVNNMKQDIDIYIKNKFDIRNIELEQVFYTKELFANYICYLFMLKWLNPKKILLVVSYSYHALVWASSALKIPTVEIQHGVISSEHLGYSVPVNMSKRLFPDYLLLFGNYWKQAIDNFPLPTERLFVFGYPYFERLFAEKSKLLERKEEQIVVVSQGTIGRELSKFAIKLAILKKGVYKVIYKLHPGEWGRERTLFSELYEAKEQGLLEVVDTDTPALYTLFSQSRWQIGVYSTALFEGIAFGCTLILVDLPGVEYMAKLIENKYAQLVKTPEEIQFDKTENAVTPREELFACNWRSNWHKFEKINLQCRS